MVSPWKPGTGSSWRMSGDPDIGTLGLSPSESALPDGVPPSRIVTCAPAMGFRSVEDLFEEGDSIVGNIEARRQLTRRDWTRALLATEIVLASIEWPDTTGFDDGDLKDATNLQYKLAGVVLRRG